MSFNYKVHCKNRIVFNQDNSLETAYYADVRKYPLLTEDEERELLLIYKNSDVEKDKEKAKEKLINSNLRFVISIAKKLGNGDNFFDLVNEGNIGLIKSIEKFDIDKKCRLITYAVSWIVAYIKNYQFTQEKCVIPPNTQKLHNYIKNVSREFFSINEREPTAHEIADMVREKFDFNISNLEDIELGRIVSIDEKVTKNEDSESIGNSRIYTSRTSSNNIENNIEEEYKRHQLDFFLGKLTDREKFIVERVYGIGKEQESFDTIGMQLDICGERVRQLCKNAVRKMKKYKNMINC